MTEQRARHWRGRRLHQPGAVAGVSVRRRGAGQAMRDRRPRRHARRVHDRRQRDPARLHPRQRRSARDATAFAPEPFRTGAASAALLNGTSGHALDWDDTQLSTSAGSDLRPADASDDAAARGGAGARRTAARLGRAVPRGVSHGLRGGVQDRGGDPSASLQEGIPLIGHRRDVRRDGGGGKAARPGSRGHGARAGDRRQHGLRHPRQLRDDDEAAARGPGVAERRHRRGAGGERLHGRPRRARSAVGVLPGLQLRRRVRSPIASSDRLGNPYTIVSPGVSIKPYPCGVLGPSDDGRDAQAGRRQRREAGADHGHSSPRRLEHPQPAALSDRAQRARGQVLPGVHGVGHRASAQGRASTSSPTSSCAARRCSR